MCDDTAQCEDGSDEKEEACAPRFGNCAFDGPKSPGIEFRCRWRQWVSRATYNDSHAGSEVPQGSLELSF